jgi:lipoprotein NlpD
MTKKWPRTAAQILCSVGAAASLGACTITPWTESTRAGGANAQHAAPPSGVPAGFYRVNPGDSLQSIAAAFGQRPEDIANWTRMTPTMSVTAGQILRVAPPPATAPGGTMPPEASSVRLAWPVRGPILSTFGAGKSKGIVIGGRIGDPVRAAAAGRVVYAGTGMEAYGPLIIIKHDATLITAYGHNRTLLVKEGDAVTQGQTIAEMGADANGSGSLQFEVRSGGKPVDPLALLPKGG